PEVISAFRKKYPLVKFQFMQGAHQELIDAVTRGSINIALLGPVPTDNPKVRGSVLFTENIHALVPMGHWLAKEDTINLAEVREEDFIVFAKGFILRDSIMDVCQQFGFQRAVAFDGQDIDALKGMVSAGLGVTLLPEVTLAD